jgi:hypothetical protein
MDDPLIRNQDAAIEDALRTYPLTGPPADLTPGVVSRLRTEAAPRYRLTAPDLLSAAALALAIGAAWFGFDSLPAPALIHLRIQMILLWQDLLVHARWWLPLVTLAAGAALGLAAFQSLRQAERQ